MNVVFFVSGSGGNLSAALRLQDNNKELFEIKLIITDRPNIKSIEIAKKHKIPYKIYDFKSFCGDSPLINPKINPEEYWYKSEKLHDKVYTDILNFEKNNTLKFDLAVLTYRRIIKGKLLHYFKNRMINQHPGDLTVKNQKGERKYIGMNAVSLALHDNSRTRTSTIMVRNSMDSGEILCQGPWVVNKIKGTLSKSEIEAHENVQKEKSDWPSIQFAIEGISRGHFYLSQNTNNEKLKDVKYKQVTLPEGGYSITL